MDGNEGTTKNLVMVKRVDDLGLLAENSNAPNKPHNGRKLGTNIQPETGMLNIPVSSIQTNSNAPNKHHNGRKLGTNIQPETGMLNIPVSSIQTNQETNKTTNKPGALYGAINVGLFGAMNIRDVHGYSK